MEDVDLPKREIGADQQSSNEERGSLTKTYLVNEVFLQSSGRGNTGRRAFDLRALLRLQHEVRPLARASLPRGIRLRYRVYLWEEGR